ncbi:unnamed protein product [Eruca vesicaria subsp. sativa]|uniref:Uncharacterized protein n=1 Tax=Eruca vesicaria subsp. sativa TaxID=29727 RepID=A0ABC8LNA3_ERUVS|nr:unnamed protein product [Eruca vesicaria subsp. sativa]
MGSSLIAAVKIQGKKWIAWYILNARRSGFVLRTGASGFNIMIMVMAGNFQLAVMLPFNGINKTIVLSYLYGFPFSYGYQFFCWLAVLNIAWVNMICRFGLCWSGLVVYLYEGCFTVILVYWLCKRCCNVLIYLRATISVIEFLNAVSFNFLEGLLTLSTLMYVDKVYGMVSLVLQRFQDIVASERNVISNRSILKFNEVSWSPGGFSMVKAGDWCGCLLKAMKFPWLQGVLSGCVRLEENSAGFI